MNTNEAVGGIKNQDTGELYAVEIMALLGF